jgi:hypothetical protein
MSEQDKPKSYMQLLDEWMETYVIGPLLDHSSNDHEQTVAYVKMAIREKVLDSYRNGQKAGPAKGFKR